MTENKIFFLAKNNTALAFQAIFLMCFFLFSLSVRAQNDTIKNTLCEQIFSGNFSQLYVDNLSNYYLINNDGNGFKKYNQKGDSLGVYNQVRKYGIITDLDVSNPIKSLLYYKDFNTVVALDRLLNTTAVFDLRRSGVLQSTAIALSYDNLIWVFDSRETKLKKINDDGKIIFESADFKTLFADIPQPQKIIDRDGLLYLYDKNYGVYIFDYYGAFKKLLPFKNFEDVQINQNKFYGRKNNQLFVTEINGFKENVVDFSFENEMQQLQLKGNFVFVLIDGNIFKCALRED